MVIIGLKFRKNVDWKSPILYCFIGFVLVSIIFENNSYRLWPNTETRTMEIHKTNWLSQNYMHPKFAEKYLLYTIEFNNIYDVRYNKYINEK